MPKVSVVIPNYNGEKYIKECMEALLRQSEKDFDVIFVDNASDDNSLGILNAYFDKLNLKLIKLDENFGFAKAVNEGIKASDAEYVILLNNDTHVGKHFVGELLIAIMEDDKIFAAQALMLKYDSPDKVDSAGDYFCGLGVAFSVGKDKPASGYREKKEIFSACAGAAIYRKKIFEEIGYFEEEFFAYLEDVDICYRAKLYGYHNIIAPKAKVLHIGSGSSGSRYNEFKVNLSARNSILLMYRNFAGWQWIVNFIPVLVGLTIKAMFFIKKKMIKAYVKGIFSAFKKFRTIEKTHSENSRLNYIKIEKELLYNILIRSGMKR